MSNGTQPRIRIRNSEPLPPPEVPEIFYKVKTKLYELFTAIKHGPAFMPFVSFLLNPFFKLMTQSFNFKFTISVSLFFLTGRSTNTKIETTIYS